MDLLCSYPIVVLHALSKYLCGYVYRLAHDCTQIHVQSWNIYKNILLTSQEKISLKDVNWFEKEDIHTNLVLWNNTDGGSDRTMKDIFTTYLIFFPDLRRLHFFAQRFILRLEYSSMILCVS